MLISFQHPTSGDVAYIVKMDAIDVIPATALPGYREEFRLRPTGPHHSVLNGLSPLALPSLSASATGGSVNFESRFAGAAVDTCSISSGRTQVNAIWIRAQAIRRYEIRESSV